MEEPEVDLGEIQAVAWLSLTNDELIERSASLGLPGDLHPDGDLVPGGRSATSEQVVQARQEADNNARLHASDEFVDNWIRENRVT